MTYLDNDICFPPPSPLTHSLCLLSDTLFFSPSYSITLPHTFHLSLTHLLSSSNSHHTPKIFAFSLQCRS